MIRKRHTSPLRLRNGFFYCQSCKCPDSGYSYLMSHVFILEGPDACGKSTALKTACSILQARNPSLPMTTLREPGGTIIGEQIRHMLANKTSSISFGAEFSLFWTGRFDLYERQILPFTLESPKGIILLDRSFPSTYAYQVAGRCGSKAVEAAYFAQQNLLLDIISRTNTDLKIHYVYFEVSLDIAQKRKFQRKANSVSENDILQFDDDAFQARVIAGYEKYFAGVEMQIASLENMIVTQTVNRIDANQSEEEVAQAFEKIVRDKIAE